ncbi:ABC transporter substrate-binding protein [Spongiibacter sp. KMU-158]|uniref:ABC transporter substrate-binding protein n=1 Tax=Spongiibacter pelagi TaxID=2760804 RepID=A0A927C1S8_9GAMM|nr:ABC transporter substrate-binding protein [Spongiibacter pelagi]MBD2859710.1 ABC transporter substrate-binding protein [Spongiibacter pelagi]
MFKKWCFVLFSVLLGASLASANVAKGPYQVVADTTQELLQVIEEAKGYIDEDEPRFTREILRIMNEVVDFQSFARGVMGDYGSSTAYRQLQTEEERKAFRDRVFKFTDTFRDGLINTYSKGLLAFNGNRIEVQPELIVTEGGKATEVSFKDAKPEQLKGTVSVRQYIYGERSKPYEIVYSLSQGKGGEWKLRNVIIEGLNLGQIYQNQFLAAAKTEGGDIDKVIENWTVTPQEVMEQQASAE